MRKVEHSTRPFYPEAWGIRLAELRRDQGWKQEDLATEADVDMTRISHWERGRAGRKYGPSPHQALELARVFAGRSGGLRRPVDVVDWLGLIGITVSEAELAHMGSGEQWRAALALPRVSRYQVPVLPTPYIERTALLARARESLLNEASGRAPLVLVGAGGLGKSTLAAALAADRTVRARLPHGVLWGHAIFLSETKRVVRANDLLHNWALALGVTVEPKNSLRQRLAQELCRQRVLLVLDNFEEYDDIQPFLIAGPDCRVIITTRNLGIMHHLPAGSPKVEVGNLTDDEAERLLAAIIGEPPERTRLLDMIAHARGDVQAIEMTGKYAKMYGIERTLADLKDPDRRWPLVFSPEDAQGPAQSKARTYALSYGSLNQEEQRCFRSLGQLEGAYKFTVPVFQVLADVSDPVEATRMLQGFVDLSLLRPDDEGYRLHPNLFEYARALLKEAGEWDPEHRWIRRYRGEWIKRWRWLFPSVPPSPAATVRAAGGFRQWLKAGWQEFRSVFRRDYEEVIVEGWDSQDVPLERWIALKRLQQRGQAYRRGAPWLAAIVLTALGMLIGLSLISPSWLGEMRLSSLYLALADGFFAIGMGGIFLALWLGTMLMIDLHRLRNWR